MRIWIDLCNSPHVNFFARMIGELREAHEVVITCRPLANTIDILELHGIPYHVVGRHYGPSTLRKAAGFAARVMQLYLFLRDRGIDVAISHSSFYSPLVARLLGAPSVYLNDNEHADGNRIAFLLANRIIVPEHIRLGSLRRQNARGDKVIQYRGVKEGIYLWDSAASVRRVRPRRKGKRRKAVYVRPEPWAAQYYNGRRNFMDQLLVELQNEESVELTVLPRGDLQREHYRGPRFSRVTVPVRSYRLAEVTARCDLFIGAGGTMTREAAVLGIPTISVYQGSLLSVDRYLMRRGLMIHERDLTVDTVMKMLREGRRRPPDRGILAEGRSAYELVKATLLENGRAEAGGVHA